MMMWGDYDAGWWIVMWLSMMVFWVLLIVGTIIVVKSLRSTRHHADSPEDILKRRFASGEIDTEQYRALRDELLSGPHGPSRCRSMT